MRIDVVKCPSCGAQMNIKRFESIIKCDYCNATIHIGNDESDSNLDFYDEQDFEQQLLETFLEGNYEDAENIRNKLLELYPYNPIAKYNKVLAKYIRDIDVQNSHEKLKASLDVIFENAGLQYDIPSLELIKGIISADLLLNVQKLYSETIDMYNNSHQTKEDYNRFNSRIISFREALLHCVIYVFNFGDINCPIFKHVDEIMEDSLTPVGLYCLMLVEIIKYDVELCEVRECVYNKNGKLKKEKVTSEPKIREIMTNEYDDFVKEVKLMSEKYIPPEINRVGIKKLFS